MIVTPQQAKVVEQLSKKAKSQSGKEKAKATAALGQAGLSDADIVLVKRHIAGAEVTINFNPIMRVDARNRLLIDALANSKYYLNGFETKTGGGLRAETSDTNSRNRAEIDHFGYPMAISLNIALSLCASPRRDCHGQEDVNRSFER